MLSKYERNELFELIQKSDLALADFDPPRKDKVGRTLIRHSPTGGSLSIGDEDREGFRLVAVDRRVPKPLPPGEWQGLVQAWLVKLAHQVEEIERDRDTPDLWAEWERERERLNGPVPAPAENTYFTADEQAEIETRLREVAAYAAEANKFDDDELRIVHAKVDYLIESSKHSRRFDWREQVVGAFLSAVVGNLLPQGATIDVLNTIVGTVGHLIGHPVPGLPR